MFVFVVLVTVLTVAINANHTYIATNARETSGPGVTPTPITTPIVPAITQFSEISSDSIQWSTEFSGPGESRLANREQNRLFGEQNRLLDEQTIQFNGYNVSEEGFIIYNIGSTATQYYVAKDDGTITSEAFAGTITNISSTHAETAYIALQTTASTSIVKTFSVIPMTAQADNRLGFDTETDMFSYTSRSDGEGMYYIISVSGTSSTQIYKQSTGQLENTVILSGIAFSTIRGLRVSSTSSRIYVAVFTLQTVYFFMDLPFGQTPTVSTLTLDETIVDLYMSKDGTIMLVLTATSLVLYTRSSNTFSLVETLEFEDFEGISLGVHDLNTTPVWCCIGNDTDTLVLVPCESTGFTLDSARVMITSLSDTSGACAIRLNTYLYVICSSSSGSTCILTSIDTATM